MSRHYTTLQMDFGEELLNVGVDFTYTPGARSTGPSWNDPGDPGYPPEIEIEDAYFVSDDEHTVGDTPDWQKKILVSWARYEKDEELCAAAENERVWA